MIKRLTLSAILSLAVLVAFGQPGKCPNFPADFSWNTPQDYAASRDMIHETLEWLCKTPIGQDVEKRAQANYYVMSWITGTPEFTLQFETKVLPVSSDRVDLYSIVIYGMALYKMDHPSENDAVKLHCKGVEVFVRLAERSEELSGESDIKPVLRAHRRGKLKEYVEKRLIDTTGQN